MVTHSFPCPTQPVPHPFRAQTVPDVEGGASGPAGGSNALLELKRERAEALDASPVNFFDGNGLMRQEADPLKVLAKKRGLIAQQKRIPDPNAPYLTLDDGLPRFLSDFSEGAAGVASFRLHVQLGKIELATHPLMSREQWLARQMLTLYRDVELRKSVGLEEYYENRLLSVEEVSMSRAANPNLNPERTPPAAPWPSPIPIFHQI